ncbi:phage holin family protein [Vallicoccus soli]|nr:phage holin family protein [Vallicoccus soli]
MSGAHSVGSGAGTGTDRPVVQQDARPQVVGEAYTEDGHPDVEGRSVGELVGELTSDLSRLMRQEVELAKAEVRQEATKAGKAAGMFGGAGVAGYFAVLFLSLTIMWAIAELTDLTWLGALVVTLLWAIAGAVLYSRAKKQMALVNPKPEQTIETLKEDAEWARTRSS